MSLRCASESGRRSAHLDPGPTFSREGLEAAVAVGHEDVRELARDPARLLVTPAARSGQQTDDVVLDCRDSPGGVGIGRQDLPDNFVQAPDRRPEVAGGRVGETSQGLVDAMSEPLPLLYVAKQESILRRNPRILIP
jgi:hypothetical protein